MKKKAGDDFPPFAELLAKTKLPPRRLGGPLANRDRMDALTELIASDPRKLVKGGVKHWSREHGWH